MKRVLRIAIALLLAMVLLDMVFIFSTRSIIYDAKRAVMGEIEPNEDIGALIRYYRRDDLSRSSELTTKLTIIPIYSIHNFHTGYMYIIYSEETTNKSTGELIHGSWCIPSKWKIERIMGKWKVVQIIEDP